MADPTTQRQQTFQSLLDRHANIVLKVANTYCWHPEDRRDLSQEIRTQLWRAFPAYDETRRFSTWMYRVALNVAISHVRRAIARRDHTTELLRDDLEVVDERGDADTQDARIALLQCFIHGLDPLNRALLLLYMEEHSYAEIAEVLGITTTNVATKINRLKQRLRTQIANADK